MSSYIAPIIETLIPRGSLYPVPNIIALHSISPLHDKQLYFLFVMGLSFH